VKRLLDENLSASHAEQLRKSGHDAIAVREIGLGGAEDVAIRRCALEQQRTLVTLDADFGHILRFPPEGTAGVIWLQP
jgi:predicted nuclease of predicted toxin-antitoxin system